MVCAAATAWADHEGNPGLETHVFSTVVPLLQGKVVVLFHTLVLEYSVLRLNAVYISLITSTCIIAGGLHPSDPQLEKQRIFPTYLTEQLPQCN